MLSKVEKIFDRRSHANATNFSCSSQWVCIYWEFGISKLASKSHILRINRILHNRNINEVGGQKELYKCLTELKILKIQNISYKFYCYRFLTYFILKRLSLTYYQKFQNQLPYWFKYLIIIKIAAKNTIKCSQRLKLLLQRLKFNEVISIAKDCKKISLN